MPKILNDKVEVKFNFTLANRPMEVFTFIAESDFYPGTITNYLTEYNSARIRKGTGMSATVAQIEGPNLSENDVYEFWNDWVTDQEMLDNARNGDTD